MIDERTEQLISRRLDGELNGEQSLELDKLLIRSPEARAIADDLQAIDALAGQTLKSLFDNAKGEATSTPAIVKVQRQSWHRWSQWGLSAAAAVLLMISGAPLLTSIQSRNVNQNASSALSSGPIAQAPQVHPSPATLISNDLARQRNVEPDDLTGVIVGPREYQEQIDRDVIGVVDPETKSVYLLELQTDRNKVHSLRANY